MAKTRLIPVVKSPRTSCNRYQTRSAAQESSPPVQNFWITSSQSDALDHIASNLNNFFGPFLSTFDPGSNCSNNGQ
ncbi:UNVERIFIED_CONTAM: hypothetical protein Slati_2964800 [Sesamum latifolium]|uniref:Uncharacterized protein n=1 Tax=Sesamum latifolium TaxID=2727402 RepID=A0AAW2VEU2_9LAMI